MEVNETDETLLSKLVASSWERIQLADDIVGVADACSKAKAASAVEEFLGIPEFIDSEISEEFDMIQLETTRRVVRVRVGTDLSWTLSEA